MSRMIVTSLSSYWEAPGLKDSIADMLYPHHKISSYNAVKNMGNSWLLFFHQFPFFLVQWIQHCVIRQYMDGTVSVAIVDQTWFAYDRTNRDSFVVPASFSSWAINSPHTSNFALSLVEPCFYKTSPLLYTSLTKYEKNRSTISFSSPWEVRTT